MNQEQAAEGYAESKGYRSDKNQYTTTPCVEWNSRYNAFIAGADWQSKQGGLQWVTEIDKARFWSKVNDTGYCWEWTAAKDYDGYGMFKCNGIYQRASRWAYIFINGEIPESLHVLHKCDNPSCVNPTHLFTGKLKKLVITGRGQGHDLFYIQDPTNMNGSKKQSPAMNTMNQKRRKQNE